MNGIIPEKLQKYIDDIIMNNYSKNEWLRIKKEVEDYFKELTEEQIEYFAESGAGEILYMMTAS